MRRQALSFEDRFWRRVEKTNGCWIWRGSVISGGYGDVDERIHGKRVFRIRAHRLSWELANGPIPDGLHVCHKCDNPPCVNPDHLFLGTDADNSADKLAKGRQPRGAKAGPAKLIDSEVVEMRAAYDGGEHFRSLAARFRVSPGCVCSIVHNRSRVDPSRFTPPVKHRKRKTNHEYRLLAAARLSDDEKGGEVSATMAALIAE